MTEYEKEQLSQILRCWIEEIDISMAFGTILTYSEVINCIQKDYENE